MTTGPISSNPTSLDEQSCLETIKNSSAEIIKTALKAVTSIEDGALDEKSLNGRVQQKTHYPTVIDTLLLKIHSFTEIAAASGFEGPSEY